MKKMFRWLLMTVLMLLLSGAFAVLWINEQLTQPWTLAKRTELLIPRGTGLNESAEILEKTGIIANAELFILYMRLSGNGGKIKAGEYAFENAVSLEMVAKTLTDGEVIIRSITIPEGKALAEIKDIFYANPYLSGKITLNLAEGDILPETYHFIRGESRNAVLTKAKNAMRQVLAEIYEGRDKRLPLKSPNDLLVLASIVEKETGVAGERAKVASVFVNRLRAGMKLQTDPTVIYAVTHGEMNLGRELLRKDLAFYSPYNTYINTGLPPAPICSPGREALMAAAHPENTMYLYFVADGISGGHRFAQTLAEHNRNVAMYRQNKKQLKANAKNGTIK